VKVLWNPTDDDFLPKPPELLRRGWICVGGAGRSGGAGLCALRGGGAPGSDDDAAVMCALEWEIEEAMTLIETRRPVVDFADVYVESVRRFLEARVER